MVNKGLKVSAKTQTLQLSLFEAEKLDVSVMSPIEAMNKLYELQKRVQKGI